MRGFQRDQCVDAVTVIGRGVSAELSGGYAWSVSTGYGGDTPTLTISDPFFS